MSPKGQSAKYHAAERAQSSAAREILPEREERISQTGEAHASVASANANPWRECSARNIGRFISQLLLLMIAGISALKVSLDA